MAKPLILAVDDEELNLMLIQVALRDVYEVVTANSGEECLRLIKDIKPVLILLDLAMDGVSGHEVCEHLQADDATKSIPIVFITGNEETPNRIKAYANGAIGYILKPIDPNKLQGKIDSILKREALSE